MKSARGEAQNDRNETLRQASPHSSRRSGSFMDHEPVFDSENSDSETDLASVSPQREVVSVVWQNLRVEHVSGSLSKNGKKATLKGVSGYAEPRSLLAVVGPANSGKTSLVSLIGNCLWRRTKATGSLIINGKSMKETWVKPTFICASDEPLPGITVEQALIYSATLEMPDHGANLETEVRDVCQRLGLLQSLSKDTHSLDIGTKRRLTVATQFLRCSPLLVLHDVLEGLNTGDALAIVRAVADMTRDGCTAILSCCQPSTDACAFFTRAYILVDGQVVYFGGSDQQAADMLSNAGMPCPPVHSPVEQYYRLVDPSFEGYLQMESERGPNADWTEEFSSIMFTMLQSAYQGSAAQIESNQRAELLATSFYEPYKTKQGVSWYRQVYASVHVLVLQGLQGLSLYLGRMLLSAAFGLIYGGSYWKLNNSFRGAEERTTILFIASVLLPSLAIGSLPLYYNSHRAWVKDRRRGRSGVATFFFSYFVLTLLHLAVAAVFAAVTFIPMVSLNQQGSAWGYFIVNTTFAHMCAEAIVLVFATMPFTLAWLGAVAVLTVQMLACGFFPGANRGFNLPWHIVGFMPWSYKGLLQSEFLYRKPTTWDCPTGEGLEAYGNCQLDNTAMYKTLSQGQILLTNSRWNSLYILLGIYGAWTIVYLAIVGWKIRPNTVQLSGKYEHQDILSPRQEAANGTHNNGTAEDNGPSGGANGVEVVYDTDRNPSAVELQHRNRQYESPV